MGNTSDTATGISSPASAGLANSGRAISVFILDDHEIVRRGLTELINSHATMRVVGEAATASSAIQGIERSVPDVAILDVRLAEGCGLDVCREVHRSLPTVSLILLTSVSDERLIVEAHRAGAAAVCPKSVRPNDLIDMIRSVANGAELIDSEAVEQAMQVLAGRPDPCLAALNERELRMMELIGLGWSNRQIGEELIFAEKTVKNYVSRLLSKLEMSRRAEVAALAGRVAEREAGWEELTS